MEWIQILQNAKVTQHKLQQFLNLYGLSGLEQAMYQYETLQQEYICNTKKSLAKIKVNDIYYLKISGHEIHIYTQSETFRKYGTLNKELQFLSHYGFIRCHQSYIVSLAKIKTICQTQLILINNQKIPLSRRHASKVILAFHNTY